MNMVEVKTADLVGRALDWAVAEAQGWVRYPEDSVERGAIWHTDPERPPFGGLQNVATYRPSLNWGQGGPLIEQYKLDIEAPMETRNGPWNANTEWGHPLGQKGDTPLIAVCRAIVAARLGATVSVPAELLCA